MTKDVNELKQYILKSKIVKIYLNGLTFPVKTYTSRAHGCKVINGKHFRTCKVKNLSLVRNDLHFVDKYKL